MSMPEIKHSCISRQEAITDLIGSVALEQTALSHILNAEGEKLQAIIACESDVDTLLAANKSVRAMVDTITRLELVLQSKLGLFENCLCEEYYRKPQKPCDNK